LILNISKSTYLKKDDDHREMHLSHDLCSKDRLDEGARDRGFPEEHPKVPMKAPEEVPSVYT